MKAQDVLPAVAGFHLEIAKRHAPGIQETFVPSVKDKRNLKSLLAPFKTERFLGFAVFVPSEYGDLLKLHTVNSQIPTNDVQWCGAILLHPASRTRNGAVLQVSPGEKL
jgi:hypothetical protein